MTYPVLLAFAILLSGIAILIIPNSYGLTPPVPIIDYNEQKLLQQDYLWHLGKNLSIGDSYTYKICDPKAVLTSAFEHHYFTQGKKDHNSSTCYTIKLDFVNLLTSDENQINNQRDVWVVQAAIDRENDDLRYSVFHIDTQTFEVTSADTIHPDTKKYADSLQKTLFSLFKYTAPEPQLLQIGQDWDEVTEALQPRGENPHMSVLNNNQEFSVTQNEIVRLIDKKSEPITREFTDAFEVGYEIDIQDPVIFDEKKNKLVSVNEDKDNNNVTTSFLISTKLPFPLYGESYNPVYVEQPQKEFEFELLVFQTNNNNIDFEKLVIDELKDADLSITETGTIRLTFTQDQDDIISEEDEIETVPEDDNEVIDDVVEEDDNEILDDGQEVIPEDDVEITSNDVTKVNNDKVDYSKVIGLVILLSVMIAGFVIFKKFRESGFKNTLLKQKPQQYQSTKKKKIIIPFDDKIHINIRSKEKI